MIDPAAMDLLAPSGIPSAKFAAHGDSVEGAVKSAEKKQQTDIDGNLKTWDNGDPMWQVVITLQTDERDADIEDDDGRRRLFAKGKMLEAIKAALTESKLTLTEDLWLKVMYYADGEPTKKGYTAPKLFKAKAKPAAVVADLDF